MKIHEALDELRSIFANPDPKPVDVSKPLAIVLAWFACMSELSGRDLDEAAPKDASKADDKAAQEVVG